MSDSVPFYEFVQRLPEQVLEYSVGLWRAAATHAVDPWHLVAILWRESLAGTSAGYSPKHDPSGTGDRIPRSAGTRYTQPSGHSYSVPTSGMPEDGLGWGRGLMQVDWAAHHEWCATGGWKDADLSFDYAAKLLAGMRKTLSTPGPVPVVAAWRISTGIPKYGIKPWKDLYPLHLPINPRPLAGLDLDRASLAAYNAGPNGVLQALSVGAPAEAATSGQNYVSWCESHIAQWQNHVVH